jgi:uncharacterized protein YdhG (YjbR/CyaY superfamily)
MATKSKRSKLVDEYIAGQAADTATKMRRLRVLFHKAQPGFEEVIKYGFPCFMYQGHNATYFNAIKGHVSVYALYHPKFKQAMEPYLAAKGTLRFPLDEPLPETLILKAVKQRIAGLKAADQKKAKKK